MIDIEKINFNKAEINFRLARANDDLEARAKREGLLSTTMPEGSESTSPPPDLPPNQARRLDNLLKCDDVSKYISHRVKRGLERFGIKRSSKAETIVDLKVLNR